MCIHSRDNKESTLVYKGTSERTFEQYYQCTNCGGFKVFSGSYPSSDITGNYNGNK